MDNSSDKLTKSHTRRFGDGKKRKLEERTRISSDGGTKQRHKDQLCKNEIDNSQQNSKYRLCGDRDKTINHIISKLAQKNYKTRCN